MSRCKSAIVLATLLSAVDALAQSIGVNVLVNRTPDQNTLADLGTHGQVLDVMPEIRAVTLRAAASELLAIQALPYVAGANADQVRGPRPQGAAELEASLSVSGPPDGATLWNLDAINVTDFALGRTVAYDGEGVYVADIGFGLVVNWREYFPEDRIDTVHARAFVGGGGNQGGMQRRQPISNAVE